jgi:hypothetical protein
MKLSILLRSLMLTPFLLFIASVAIDAQTTEFTYQGKLTAGNASASGNYDFQFRLYDASSNLLGTQTRLGVPVSNGIFTINLDFGSQFSGAPRFLEIAVRSAGGTTYTILSPRQQIKSAPYSIKSLNAETAENSTQLGGINANQYVRTTDSRLSDARNPLSGSNNYIQNNPSLAGQNATINITNSAIIGNDVLVGGNLSVNGNASAEIYSGTAFNATSNFRINGQRVLAAVSSNNTFAGLQTGNVNTGADNSFFGFNAGNDNTSGANNSFFGSDAGGVNTTGYDNSFFGSDTGDSNTTGVGNSFFGRNAGSANTTASENSFFGWGTGQTNSTGVHNSFFGARAGEANTTASENAFFGAQSGRDNSIGDDNSFFGAGAGLVNTTGQDNAYFGRGAGQASNGSQNAFFGMTAGGANTLGSSNSFFGRASGGANTTGNFNIFIGKQSGNTNTTGSNNTVIGANADVNQSGLTYATAIGSDSVVTTSNTIQLGRLNGSDRVKIAGQLQIGSLFSEGNSFLCHNTTFGYVATCSSSLRYKTAVQTFTSGLDVVRRLRPISFQWKTSRKTDVGFGAEEVAAVEPSLITYNKQGEIEGVKYAQITTVLVNAVNEQQTQIEAQTKQLQQQQLVIDGLRKLVCSQKPQAEVCKEK